VLRGWRLGLLTAAARAAGAAGGAASALWTFPSVLLAALIVAWGAEAAQFFMSQGLALAILAWLQTLPEFAVEADIAWRQDVPDMTANFTGSLRLLVGLGWPMIFVVASYVHKRRSGQWLKEIVLSPEHSVEVMGLLLPVLYFFVIWWKASLTVWDAAVLVGLYVAYLVVLNRLPTPEQEEVGGLDFVPRALMSLRPGLRGAGIASMFVVGGLILYYVTHPFVDSLKSLALSAGISEFVFIQWVAPFLSEFPEKVSAFKWASTVRQAPMALMNLVSSNINQWTVLAGMIPLVYSLSAGAVMAVTFDGMHRLEILLTILQSLLGLLLLLNMRYSAGEALILFVLWLVQFVVPSIREAIAWAYGALILGALVQLPVRHRSLEALQAFSRQWRASPARRPLSEK
jgi:cation:H+ antiporter